MHGNKLESSISTYGRLVLLFFFLSFLGACALSGYDDEEEVYFNPFKGYYKAGITQDELNKYPIYILTKDPPKVMKGCDDKHDALAMHENGFVMIGYSSFNGTRGSVSDAANQAKNVHAEVAIYCSKHTETMSRMRAVSSPDIKFSTSSGQTFGSGTITNSYGDSFNYSGRSSAGGGTTTFGTKTTYVQDRVSRYDFSATYWVKTLPPIFGAFAVSLKPEERRLYQTNKGAKVHITIIGSPAFNADIFRGDIIKKIGNSEVVDGSSYGNAVKENSGRNVKILILRDKELITKDVYIEKLVVGSNIIQ